MDKKYLAGAAALAISLFPYLGGCSSQVTDDSVPRVSVQDVARRLDRVGDGIELLDTRDRAAFERSHIPGARHVTLPEIDPSNPTTAFVGRGTLIVYGENPGSGTAVAIAKRLYRTMGRVEWMEAGFQGWVQQGLAQTGAASRDSDGD